MFTVYVDDSGTSPSQQIAIAAALVAPHKRWLQFETEFNRLKEKEQFGCFHTSECVWNNRKSEFANWNEDKKLRVIRRIRQMTKKYAVHAIALALYKPYFDEIVTGEFREIAGKYHYTIAIRSLLGGMSRWRGGFHSELKAQKCEYIFDWMAPRTDGRREEVESVLTLAPKATDALTAFGGYEGFYSFRKRCDIVPLQAVDLLAWSYYQAARQFFMKSPVHPIARESLHDYGQDNWLDSRLWSKERLRQWVSDPDALRAIERNKQMQAAAKRP